MIAKFRLTTGMAIVLAGGQALAATGDAQGCKDPAMFPDRVPGYTIAKCATANDAADMRTRAGVEKVMGTVTRVLYQTGAKGGGATQDYVLANYQNALKGIGAEVLVSGITGYTARLEVEGRDTWVRVQPVGAVFGGNLSSYEVIIAAKDAGAQVVTAQRLLNALEKDGFVTLYINFETNKWDLKPDAAPVIQQIVGLLKLSPALRVSIDGHTDNVGTPEANKTLSENRARSVMQAVAGAGIDAKRMQARGFGAEKPIADNRREDGRAKNRRADARVEHGETYGLRH